MKDSNNKLRFFLGVSILAVGLLSVGIVPSNANKTIRGSVKQTQGLHAPQARPEKFIGKLAIYPNEPVYVVDLTVKGIAERVNSYVSAGEDWLDGMTFKVRNISKKNIVFIYASLIFPDAKDSKGISFVLDLRYGSDPKVGPAPQGQQPLKPDEAAEFVVTNELYQNFKRGIETHSTPFKNVNGVQIDILKVVFDDDTAWATGSFMHRDPNNPRRWIDN